MNLAEKLKAKRDAKANGAPAQATHQLSEEEARQYGISEAQPEEPEVRASLHQPRKRNYLPEIHQSLPQSDDAERGVIGSILLSPTRGMHMVESAIGKAHFHNPVHQLIFGSLQEMFSAGIPIDLITVTQYLNDKRRLDEAGGASYITDIFVFVPTASNLSYYLALLCEKFVLRELIASGTVSVSDAFSGAFTADELLDREEERIRAIRSMGSRNGKLPELDDMTMLIGSNLPAPPPELVRGLLHQGSKIIVGGTSKGRKTFSLMDLGISVACGTPWWEFPTIQGRVCYLNFEIQRPFFAKRFEDICRKLGVMPKPGQFMSWTLRGMVEGLEKMSDQLIRSLTQYDFSLIIVDPIYKALGDRDENKAGDVASLCNELERIAVRTGAAIAFGAHYSKGNQAAKEAIDRIGGSGVFARDPDSILTMTPHEEEECFTVDATLRNFPPCAPFVVHWEWPIFVRDEMADPEQLKKPKKALGSGKYEEKFADSDVLDLMHSNNISRSPTELKRWSMDQLQMSQSTFKRIWKRIKSSVYLENQNGRFRLSAIYSATIATK